MGDNHRYDMIEAVRASSIDSRSCRLSDSVRPDTTSWWISKSGTMPYGYGEQYVEFQFAKKEKNKNKTNKENNNHHIIIPVTRRINYVSVSIPPLPMGPLSVRTFRVDILVEEEEEEEEEK